MNDCNYPYDCNYPLCIICGSGCEKESICDKPDQEILIPRNEWFEKCKEVTKLKTENEKLKVTINKLWETIEKQTIKLEKYLIFEKLKERGE